MEYPHLCKDRDLHDLINMIVTAWNKLNGNHISAFKTLFVINSFDGSENYLVSDRLFKLISDSMISFRKKLIESEIPASYAAVVKKLIPTNGIKRKNQEGYYLLDFGSPDDAEEDDYHNLFDNLFKIQINFEEEKVMRNHQTVLTAPIKFFKMKAQPPSVMNL